MMLDTVNDRRARRPVEGNDLSSHTSDQRGGKWEILGTCSSLNDNTRKNLISVPRIAGIFDII